MSVFLAQLKAELNMTLRRGESLLLTIGIPVTLLIFFSLVKVIDTGTAKPVDYLAPSTLALAVISMAMVGTAIATAFEREYLVLKRLGTTPLGRGRFLAAKVASVAVVELLQIAILAGVGYTLGWRPPTTGWPTVIAATIIGTAAFTGLGLLMAGTLKATVVLAAANGLYIVLLLISGLVVPLTKFPSAMRAVVKLLPSTALAEIIRGALTVGTTTPTSAWIILLIWAVAATAAARQWFRWE
jgi:ABC-2 type transport system permease protein